MSNKQRNGTIESGILGLCVADALGVPVEFESRRKLRQNPVTDMRGYGTYNQPPGTWSDDTSMALCLLDSLANGLDYRDIADKFLSWLNNADYTPHGSVFDVGIVTSEAIHRYRQGGEPLKCGGASDRDNGNGSLMRILPLAFYLDALYGKDFIEDAEAVEIIHNVSSLTHAHKRSQIACSIYLSIANAIVNGDELDKAFEFSIYNVKKLYEQKKDFSHELKHYMRVFDYNSFKNLPEDSIDSSGYVVYTLEAALWCLLNTSNYESCVLKAVNLGGDTDTVAAIAGGLAGLLYGRDSIPAKWLEQIARLDYIKGLCTAFEEALRKMSARKLTSFIPYFENLSPDTAVKWDGGGKRDDGTIYLSYPVYDSKFMKFIDSFYHSSIVDYDYKNTLEKHYGDGEGINMHEIVKTADINQLKAILTECVRVERFCDGAWANYIKSDLFLDILRRLKNLTESN